MFLSASVCVCVCTRARKWLFNVHLSFVFLSLLARVHWIAVALCVHLRYVCYIWDRCRLFTFSFFMFCNTPTSSVAHSFPFKYVMCTIYSLLDVTMCERVCASIKGFWFECVRFCVIFSRMLRVLSSNPFSLSRFLYFHCSWLFELRA